MRTVKRWLAGLLPLLVCCSFAVTAHAATPEAPAAGPVVSYTLQEDAEIAEDAAPLGAAPVEDDCCILHFVILTATLGCALYYTHSRKLSQAREFELLATLAQEAASTGR